MTEAYFEILRSGINTTIQDIGRNHLYHLGISVSGAIDQRKYKLANKLVNNKLTEPAIEFAYQGPLLKLKEGKVNFSITGDVLFNNIRSEKKTEEGKCYRNYILNDGEQIDIISTKKSVYGYLSISGGIKVQKTWESYSINTKAEIGPNNGKKFSINQKIYLKKSIIENIKDRISNYKDP